MNNNSSSSKAKRIKEETATVGEKTRDDESSVMSYVHMTVMEQIIALEGQCISSSRCSICPFRSRCLPEFISSTPPTAAQRRDMALNALSRAVLLGDDSPLDSYSLRD